MNLFRCSQMVQQEAYVERGGGGLNQKSGCHGLSGLTDDIK